MSESTFSCQHVGCSSLNAYLSRGTAVEDSFECFLGRIDPELKQHAASLRQEGYGSRKRLSAARLEELKAVPGVRPGDARLIYGYFRPGISVWRTYWPSSKLGSF